MSDDRIPLETVEAQFASHLATLDSRTATPAAHAAALKHIAAAFMGERQLSHDLAFELATAKNENIKAHIELTRLRAIRNSIASVLMEHEQAPQTSAAASPPRLTIVRSEVDRG